MNNILDMLSYDIFRNGLYAIILASVACGIMGTYIVVNRNVFISAGITHTSFGGIGLGYFLGINPLLGALVFAVGTSLGIELFTRKIHLRNDSTIAIFWALGMATGVLFIYLTPGYAPELRYYLFGFILNVSPLELIFMAGTTILIILVFILFYHPILHTSFDEEFASTRGIPVTFIKYVMALLTAITIVTIIKVMGVILLLAFLTIPQNTANLITKNFLKIMLWSVLFGLISSTAGLLISYLLDIPSGAAIVFTLVITFGIIWIFIQLRKKSKIDHKGM